MVARVVVNERCLALQHGVVYTNATVLKVNKKTAKVSYANGTVETVPFCNVWKLKKKKSKHTSVFFKASANDRYRPRSREERFALARGINVEPVCYGHGALNGDYMRMLSDVNVRDNGLCIFNDNNRQWSLHGWDPLRPQHAGGGNACARPWQHLEHAIGIPTGPFSNLSQKVFCSFAREPEKAHTAKEVIDEAINRIVRLLVKRPEKQTVYYSVDDPNSKQIGLRIFRGLVGDDVVEYISHRIANIPHDVRCRRRSAPRVVA